MNSATVTKYALVLVITAFAVMGLTALGAANDGTNLLENPGCEEDPTLEEPSNWTQESGGPIICTDFDAENPEPAEGEKAFIDSTDDGADASITQTVDVSGGETYQISGQVSTYGSPDDYAQIEVEYRDDTDSTLTDGQIVHEVYPTVDQYEYFENSSEAPPAAKTAVVRIILVNDDGTDYADAIVDDLNFSKTSSAPTANDVAGLEVDIDGTLTESVHDDFGNGADDLGDPAGEIVSFGGGDLGGAVTDHSAGSTTSLAGGDLTLNDDGSLELAAPTEAGTYSFDYRLENDAGSDDATVTITVVDNSSFAVSVVDANESVAENETWSIDVGVENVGTNVGTQNVTLAIDDEGGTTVHQDKQEVTLAAGANDTHTFEWTPGVGLAGEYEAIASSDDDSATTNVTVYEFGSIEGAVVDANSKDPDQATIEDANVTVVFPDDTEIETTTNGTGEFSVGDIPATGEEYAIEVVADGYHGNTTTVAVGDGDPVDADAGTISLDGNATITGTIRDGATGDGVAGANATATTAIGSYDATTTADGSYTIENVPGGQDYDLTIVADGYHSNSTTGVNVGDGATHEFDASLSGNATVEGVVESDASGQGIEDANVTVVYPDDGEFTVENATGADGSFSITEVPGTGDSYDIVVRAPGFENATTTATVADGAVVDVGTLSLLGNATVAGTVEDETFASGIEGVDVNVSNGQYEFTTVTDGNGSFVVEDVPGGESYTASIDEDGWETNSTTIAVGDGENVSGVVVTIVGSDQLEATVYDQLLFDNSSDDGFLDGATVTIEHSTLGSVDRTATDGTIDPVSVPAGETYNLTATNSGYDSHALSNVSNGSLAEFFLAGNSTVNGTVTDDLTGDGLENATVTIEYPSRANATVENATNATGVYAIDSVPGTGDDYVVSASADSYKNGTATTGELSGGTATANFELLPTGEATVSGTVTDQTTGSSIANANVTVELDDDSAPGGTVVYNGTTDGDGNYTFADVIGGYDYNISVVADGYENASQVENVSENGTTAVDLELAGNATISGTIVDSPFGGSVEGASVIAVGTQGEYAAETDSGGSYTIDHVPGTGETYAVSVSADGYESADTSVILGGVGDGADVDLTLTGDATIVATVTDDVTGQAIGVDANVTVENATYGQVTVEDVSPNGADEYRVSVPGTGTVYDVTIDPVGYESGKERSTRPLGSGEQATIGETLLGSATLTGTVADDGTGDPVANATVTATGPAGTYTTETAADGTYKIQHVPGTGEQYAVTAAARAYEDADDSVSVTGTAATLDLDLVALSHYFGVEGIDAPAEVEAGKTFEIEATIANLGSMDWNDSTELVVDGTTVANESVDLDAGNNTTVTFEHAIDDVGTADVQIRTSNESVNTTVDIVAEQSSSPSPPPSPPAPSDPVPDIPDDVPVKHEEVSVIERDDETGHSGVTFSADSTVDWIIFDDDVEGTVGLAELETESSETNVTEGTNVTDETAQAPGRGVAAYRIEVPEGAENNSATIRLRVSNDRLEELNADPADLYVNRFVGDDWQRLETSVVSSDEDGVVLEAWTPGFSNFSVTAVSEPGAVIDVDPAAVEPGEEITLSAADSADQYGEIVAYEWTVGDRTIEGESVTITLDTAGEYRVELTVTNADGESDTATATLTVDGATEQPVGETTEGDGTPEDETPTETTSDGQPGFGLLAAGIALLVGLLVGRRR